MTDLYKTRIWCETELSWVESWGEEIFTHCPNDNTHTITPDKTVIIEKQLDIGPHDKSGKARIHQTSRKLGLRVMWFGEGDDTSDVHKIGGGTPIIIEHTVGSGDSPLYIDFNVCNNESFIHEGYLTWKDCNMDKLSLELVPRVTTSQAGTNTNYNLYGGYMIIPAAGNGTLDVTADLTDPNAGLIFMPYDDQGNPPTAFWNADYNPTTKLYENITPAPLGNGSYNMFSIEISFAKFMYNIPLLGNGFIALNSSDTDEIGHGFRLKITPNTNGDDHDWAVACIICMHRDK